MNLVVPLNFRSMQWEEVPCIGHIDLFMSEYVKEQYEAVAICGSCEADTKQACLELGRGARFGVFGGMTAKERKNRRKNESRQRMTELRSRERLI